MSQVTLTDVAAHAGVSRATASLVLRGTGRVSAATRQRVQDAMSELGYVYNRGAASLRQQRADTVGVVITNVANPFFGELLSGLESELAEADLSCLIINSGNDPAHQAAAITTLRERRVAAIAMVPASDAPAALVTTLRDSGTPHVFMTRYLNGARTHYVGPDDVYGGRLAAQHLIGHHVRDIAYIGGPTSVQSRWDRIAGVHRALTAADRSHDLLDIPGPSTGAGGLEAARHLLSRSALPEGIICHSDTVAFGLYRGLRAAGQQILPRIIGYDDIPTATLWEPPLTSVATHATELGRLAARNLLHQIDTPPRDHQPNITTTKPTLSIRQSCGCAEPRDA